VVFKTDAGISKKVRIACELKGESAPRIRYPMAIVRDAKQVEAARRFLQYLGTDEAAKVFQKYGFLVLP